MTRANTEQAKFVPWFAKAGAACSIVPIARFIGPNIFALKGGGYGCLFVLILLAASRTNAATVLRDAATIYKVDTDAITLKVKQEFAAKERARAAKKTIPKVHSKPTKKTAAA